MVTVLVIVVTVSLLVIAGLVALILVMHSPKAYKGPELDPYELAQLAGGRYRVLNTALTSLTGRKLARAGRDGKLTRTDTTPGSSVHPVEAEILALLEAEPDGVPIREIKAAFVRGPAVAELIIQLKETGLVDTGDFRRVEPTRLGQAALAHYRLRHREDRSLPPRARDHVSKDELNLFGVALYGLCQLKDRELSTVLSLNSVPRKHDRLDWADI